MTVGVRTERGVALIVCLIGIVVCGALVTGVFATGYVEQRIGDNTRWMERSFGVAEYGLSETIAQWNIGSFNQLLPGQRVNVAGAVPGGTGTYAGSVIRLNQELFIVDVIGTDARGQARQRLGSFVKLRPLVIDIGAALTTQGPTKVGGSAEIDGSDHVPVGWTGCPSAVPPLAGLRTPDSSVVTYTGSCSGGSCVHGVPQVNEDPTVGDSTFFEYGDLDWDALTAMANKPLPPGAYTGIDPLLTADGQCDVSKALNWGAPFDPLSPCHEYYPIIYVPGDMKINGNTGQGLLLVEGNLDVQGGFEFFGIVIVKGNLSTQGTGGHFNGGVLAANADLDQSSVLGDAIVNFSSCAIAKALAAGAPGAQLRSRGWMQVY
jgi:hypothetical protein